jgi:hypothetical protein
MKSKLALLMILLSNSLYCVYGQEIVWQKCYGGSDQDFGIGTFQTSDHGFMLFSIIKSNDGDIIVNHGEYDVWAIKIDSTGEIEWQNSCCSENYEVVYSVIQTADGGFALCGWVANETDPNYNYWILKMNREAEMEWQSSFGGSGYDIATSIAQTLDGGYIVTGYSGSVDGDVSGNHGLDDYWVVKIDSSGLLQWEKSFGGSGDDRCENIICLPDSNYAMCGFSSSNNGDVSGNHGDYDFWFVKINGSGDILWQKTYGGSNEDSNITEVLYLEDQGFLITGRTRSDNGDVTFNHGDQDIWIIKTDSIGEIEWQKTYGGSGYDASGGIIRTIDSGYLHSATTRSVDGDITHSFGSNDIWIMKINNTGDLEWQKSIGGSEFDVSGSILQISGQRFILAGSTSSNDGDVSGNHGGDDLWFVDFEILNTGVDDGVLPGFALSVVPNPAKDYFAVRSAPETSGKYTYSLMDMSGRIVKYGTLQMNDKVNIEEISKGTYIFQIKTGSGSVAYHKLTKE